VVRACRHRGLTSALFDPARWPVRRYPPVINRPARERSEFQPNHGDIRILVVSAEFELPEFWKHDNQSKWSARGTRCRKEYAEIWMS